MAFTYADHLAAEGTAVPEPPHVFTDPDDPRLPVAVREILEFPYDEGRLFAVELAARGGEAAIVDAFARPPASSEQVLDVDAYLADEQPIDVPAPSVPAGGVEQQRGALGSFLVGLLLEPAIGPDRAREIATAWAGDGYTVYDLDEQRCIAATLAFDTPEAATAMAAALDRAAAGPDIGTIDLARCAERP
ncbi:MAG: hypothetical protein S0880_11950 [Actinomycetota bacterium]|nr:hypothetical protein [Actinomycetota bacterium]